MTEQPDSVCNLDTIVRVNTEILDRASSLAVSTFSHPKMRHAVALTTYPALQTNSDLRASQTIINPSSILENKVMQSNIQCSMCSSTTSTYCTKCKCITYCSKICEKADWPLHKLVCNPLRASEYPLGIQFLEKAQSPQFVTFSMRSQRVSSNDSSDEDEYDEMNYQGYIEYGGFHPARQMLGFQREVGTLTVTGNALRSRPPSNHKIVLYYCATPPTDGSHLNQSILAATNGRVVQNWHGSLLAVKVALPAIQPPEQSKSPAYSRPTYLSLSMVDLRDIVDFLSTYPAVNISDMTSTPSTTSPKLEVPAIRINCPGDQALGRPKFEALKIRADDAACRAPVTGISHLIDLPLRVYRVNPPFPAGYDHSAHDITNLAATYLNMGVDIANGWGFVGLDWVDSAGSVIVVREGGEPLAIQHLEALCHWCLFVLKPLFEDSMGMGRHPGPPVEKSEVLARVTRREFVDFYVGFDDWKGGSDPEWKKEQLLFS